MTERKSHRTPPFVHRDEHRRSHRTPPFVVSMSEDSERWLFEYERTCRVCDKRPVARRVPDDVPGVTLKTDVPDEPLCERCVVWASKIIWLDEWWRRQCKKDRHGSPNSVSTLQQAREPEVDRSREGLAGELGARLAASPRLQSV